VYSYSKPPGSERLSAAKLLAFLMVSSINSARKPRCTAIPHSRRTPSAHQSQNAPSCV
jgi:hypothetical protein